MVDFFRAGGWGMWVVLVLSVAALVNAVLFSLKPSEKRIVLIRSLSTATCFASVTAMAMDLSTVFYYVSGLKDWDGSPRIPMEGYGESLTPITFGAGMLTLVWMVVAVGVRRSQREVVPVPAE